MFLNATHPVTSLPLGMDSNSHPHILSNDEEDMDVELSGNPDGAGIAGLHFEGFNMQTGYVRVSQLSSLLMPY